jgi:hypothetical protein
MSNVYNNKANPPKQEERSIEGIKISPPPPPNPRK